MAILVRGDDRSAPDAVARAARTQTLGIQDPSAGHIAPSANQNRRSGCLASKSRAELGVCSCPSESWRDAKCRSLNIDCHTARQTFLASVVRAETGAEHDVCPYGRADD